MAAIANDIDRALVANPAPPDTGALNRNLLIATTSPGGFKIASNGAALPVSIELSAILIDIAGTVTWSAPNGVTLAINGNAASLDAVDMTGDTATITASINYLGVPYTRAIVVQKVRDGLNGESELPPEITAESLKATLENQLTESQLYSALRTRISLIDAAPTVPGSVGARVLAETNARIDAVSAEASARNTQFANYDTGIKSYVQNYAYSKSSSDSALSSLATTLRSEFASNNGASVSWVQQYTYSKAEADSAISSATTTISTTVNGHTTTLQTQATSINGLSGQYVIKLDNNGYGSGFGLASTPVNGVPTSDFAILADRFSVALPGQAKKYPFVIGTVGGQTIIGLRGDVILDGTFTFRDASGKPLLGIGVKLDDTLVPDSAKNSELLPSIDAAKAAADAAIAATNAIAADDVLDQGEKPDIMQRFAAMGAEFNGISSQAASLGVDNALYGNSKAALNIYLDTIPTWNNTAVNTDIVRTTFNNKFNDYYTAKQALLNAIAAKINTKADDANAAITAISSDNVLSKGEKPTVIREFSVMGGEFDGLSSQAASLGVDNAPYGISKAALNTYLDTIPTWNNLTVDTTIDGPTFRAKFAGYYTAKEALRNAIAAKIQSNAAAAKSAADTANNALPGLSAAISQRLSKTGNDIMSGEVALQSKYALLIGDKINGVWIGNEGIVAVQNGVITTTIPISGDPIFAGLLAAARGTFGAVSIAAGGKLTVGLATTFGQEGVFLGYVGNVVKLSIVSGAAKLLYDPSAGTPLQIVNAGVSAPTYDAFSVTGSGGGSMQGPNGTLTNAVTLTISGNNGPHKINWSHNRLAGGIPSTVIFTDTYDNGRSFSISATASNTTINVQVSATITGADNRTILYSNVFSLQFGSA